MLGDGVCAEVESRYETLLSDPWDHHRGPLPISSLPALHLPSCDALILEETEGTRASH